MPQVSVIIPIYNGERYLAQALDSVITQTWTDWEMIIVDDGSKDGSRALAERYAQQNERIHVFHQGNAGPAGVRNRGFKEASSDSEYILFFDQDDVLEPDALETLVALLKAQPDAVGAQGMILTIDSDGQPYMSVQDERNLRRRMGIADRRSLEWLPSMPTTFAVLARANAITTPGQVLIRRSAQEAAGPWDANFGSAADWDMWLRLSLIGDFAFTDRVVLRYRRHETNMTGNGRAISQMERHLISRYVNSPDLSEEHRELVRVGYRWFKRDMSRYRWRWAWDNFREGNLIDGAKQSRHMLLALWDFYAGFHVESATRYLNRRLPTFARTYREIPVRHTA